MMKIIQCSPHNTTHVKRCIYSRVYCQQTDVANVHHSYPNFCYHIYALLPRRTFQNLCYSLLAFFLSYSDFWPVKMGPIRCHEKSVNNYYTTLRNTLEERRFQVTDLHKIYYEPYGTGTQQMFHDFGQSPLKIRSRHKTVTWKRN